MYTCMCGVALSVVTLLCFLTKRDQGFPSINRHTNTTGSLTFNICVAQVFSLGVCLFELFSKIILAADIAYDGSPAEFERYSMSVRDLGTRFMYSQ